MLELFPLALGRGPPQPMSPVATRLQRTPAMAEFRWIRPDGSASPLGMLRWIVVAWSVTALLREMHRELETLAQSGWHMPGGLFVRDDLDEGRLRSLPPNSTLSRVEEDDASDTTEGSGSNGRCEGS